MKIELRALRPVQDEDRLPPQAAVVIKVLVDQVGYENLIDKEALIAALEVNELSEGSENKLKTKQDPGRILSFYIPKLEAMGLIEKVKTPEFKEPKVKAEATEPKERKPRKAKVAVESEAVAA